MKKLILFCCVFALFVSSAQAQFSRHKEKQHFIKTQYPNTSTPTTPQSDTLKAGGGGTASDTLWSIISTARDTSRVYEAFPYESIYADLSSFASGTEESTAVSIITLMASEDEWDRGVPPFAEFAPVDTNAITADGWVVLTDGSPAYPNAKWLLFIVYGTSAANDSTRARLKRSAWDEDK